MENRIEKEIKKVLDSHYRHINRTIKKYPNDIAGKDIRNKKEVIEEILEKIKGKENLYIVSRHFYYTESILGVYLNLRIDFSESKLLKYPYRNKIHSVHVNLGHFILFDKLL